MPPTCFIHPAKAMLGFGVALFGGKPILVQWLHHRGIPLESIKTSLLNRPLPLGSWTMGQDWLAGDGEEWSKVKIQYNQKKSNRRHLKRRCFPPICPFLRGEKSSCRKNEPHILMGVCD